MSIELKSRAFFQIWGIRKSLKGLEKLSQPYEPEETATYLHQFQQSVNGTFPKICHKTFLMPADIFMGHLGLMV